MTSWPAEKEVRKDDEVEKGDSELRELKSQCTEKA